MPRHDTAAAPGPRFPVPWLRSAPESGPVRAAVAAELESALADPAMDFQRVCRVLVAATYALSGDELGGVAGEVVRVLRTGGKG